jgi:hypothetical protein
MLPSPPRRRREGRHQCGSRGEADLFFWTSVMTTLTEDRRTLVQGFARQLSDD